MPEGFSKYLYQVYTTIMAGTNRLRVTAPGRVCLFGDHQDYLGLPVIACAVNRHVVLDATPIVPQVFQLLLPDLGDAREIPLQPLQHKSGDHFISALIVLRRYGCLPDRGFEITVRSSIPINAGLSSSSALLVGWIQFLLEAFGSNQENTPEFIARLAYEAEVLEFDSPGGLMDQYTIALGGLLKLDTRTGAAERGPNILNTMVIGESGIGKQTLGVLAEKRKGALDGVAWMTRRLRDFSLDTTPMADVLPFASEMDSTLRNYLLAAMENRDITSKAWEALKGGSSIHVLGALMNAHHKVLKDRLHLTVPLIDAMIEGAFEAGALGAKIVGSGLGGCIVALCESNNADEVADAIMLAGGRAAYTVSVSEGVTKESRR